MHLVDEQDDAAVGRRHLLQHGLEPLFELAAVFRAGDQRTHVEREQLLVFQAFGYIAIDDALRQPFDNRGLADAGLADQHRIVLGAPRQHLNRSPDFLVAADHRIDLAVARGLRQIAGVFLERVIGIFSAAGIGGAALAQRIDRRVEVLRRDAGMAENLAGIAVLFQRQRQQQALDRDIAVAGLFGDLLGLVEHPRRRLRQINLAGAAAGHLRHLAERRLDRAQSLPRLSAGAVDQPGGQAFRIVEQNLEEVFGGELLMALAQREGLGRLHKAAGAVGVFFEIHA